MVHERFTAEELDAYRETNPGVVIIAHPECPPEVIAASDFAGSTAGMIGWVRTTKPAKVVMVTECSMSDNPSGRCRRRIKACISALFRQ